MSHREPLVPVPVYRRYPLPFAIPLYRFFFEGRGWTFIIIWPRLRLRPFFPRLPLFFFFGLQILGIAYTKPGDYDFLPEFVRDFVEPVSYSEVALIWLNVVGWMVGFFAWMVWMGQLHPADVKLSYRDHAYHAVGKFFLLLTGVGGSSGFWPGPGNSTTPLRPFLRQPLSHFQAHHVAGS